MDLSLTARNLRLVALVQAIDIDSSPAKMKVYSGAKPTPGGAPSGTLLATITLAKPSAIVIDDSFQWIVPKEGQRVDDLQIAWVRIEDGAGNWVVDGSAGLIGNTDVDFQFDQLDGNIGAFIRLSGGGFTE